MGLVNIAVGVWNWISPLLALTWALLTWPAFSSVRNWLYFTVGGDVADITFETRTANATTAIRTMRTQRHERSGPPVGDPPF